MQESRQAFHYEEDGNCENGEEVKHNGQQEEAPQVSGGEADVHHHGPQHLGQL